MMEFRRTEHRENYTVINNGIFRSGLSLKAIGMLSLLLSLPESWEFSVEGIAAITNEGRGAVSSAIRELEDKGLLRRQKIRREGKFAKSCIIVCEPAYADSVQLSDNAENNENKENGISDASPAGDSARNENNASRTPRTKKPLTKKPTMENPTTEKPLTEKPLTENPTTGNPTTENSTQSSTYVTNTKKANIYPSVTKRVDTERENKNKSDDEKLPPVIEGSLLSLFLSSSLPEQDERACDKSCGNEGRRRKIPGQYERMKI